MHEPNKPLQRTSAHIGASSGTTPAGQICAFALLFLGGRFRETDASVDTMARRSRKTRLYGDPVEAHGMQSSFGSSRRRPEFIQVATCLQKVIPYHQSCNGRTGKGASAEVDMVRLEPTFWSVWQGHRSSIELQRCTGIRLGTQGLQSDGGCVCTNIYSIRMHGKARSYIPKMCTR